MRETVIIKMSPNVQYEIEIKMLELAKVLMDEINLEIYKKSTKEYVKFFHQDKEPITNESKFVHWMMQPFTFFDEKKNEFNSDHHVLILFNKSIHPNLLNIRDTKNISSPVLKLDKDDINKIINRHLLDKELRSAKRDKICKIKL